MPDVFISYRRKDIDFVKQLDEALKATKREIWIDWEDIPPGVTDFSAEIARGIEESDVFIAVLSPHYLESQYCLGELDHAAKHAKKIVPLVYETFDGKPVPAHVSHINWVYFCEHAGQINTFEESFPRLISAIETDYDYVRQHTRLLVRAREWENNKRGKDSLLDGQELAKAEAWLAQAITQKPAPAPLHQEFIFASRQHHASQQRMLITRVLGALVVTVVLAIVSFLLFLRAESAEDAARKSEKAAIASEARAQESLFRAWDTQSLFLAAQANEQLEHGSPQVALQLAIESLSHYNDGIYHPSNYNALISAMNAPVQELMYLPQDNVAAYAEWNADETRLLYATETMAGFNFSLADENGQVLATIPSENGMGWNHDKTHFITWDDTGQVSLWDDDGQLVQRVEPGTITGGLWSVKNPQIVLAAEGAAHLWDIETGEVQSVQFDPTSYFSNWEEDRGYLYLENETGILVWDIATNQAVKSYPFEILQTQDSVSIPMWSNNRKHVVQYTSTQMELLTPETGEHVIFEHGGSVNTLVWSPDDTLLLIVGDDQASVWDTATGELIAQAELVIDSYVGGAVWMGNTRVFIGSDLKGNIWDFSTGDLIEFSFPQAVQGARYNPETFQLITLEADNFSRSGIAEIWDIDGLFLYQLTLKGYPIDATWNQDASRVITLSDESIQVWGLESSAILPTIIPEGFLNGADWDSTGTGFITWNGDSLVQQWDTAGKEISRFQAQGIAPSPPVSALNVDRTHFMTYQDNTVYVYNLQGELLHTLEHEVPIITVAWLSTPDQMLAYADDRLFVWDVPQEKLLHTFPFPDSTFSFQVNDEGTRLITWTDPTVGEVWDITTGEKIRTLPHDDAINYVLFKGNKILTTLADGSVWIWQDDTPLKIQVGQELYSAAFNHDASQIMTWTYNGIIQIWDSEGKLIWETSVPTMAMTQAMWSPDENYILTQAFDDGLRIWDKKGELQYSIPGEIAVSQVIWHPDSKSILTWDYNMGVEMWPLDIPTLIELAKTHSTRQLTEEERAEFFLTSTESIE